MYSKGEKVGITLSILLVILMFVAPFVAIPTMDKIRILKWEKNKYKDKVEFLESGIDSEIHMLRGGVEWRDKRIEQLVKEIDQLNKVVCTCEQCPFHIPSIRTGRRVW